MWKDGVWRSQQVRRRTEQPCPVLHCFPSRYVRDAWGASRRDLACSSFDTCRQMRFVVVVLRIDAAQPSSKRGGRVSSPPASHHAHHGHSRPVALREWYLDASLLLYVGKIRPRVLRLGSFVASVATPGREAMRRVAVTGVLRSLSVQAIGSGLH